MARTSLMTILEKMQESHYLKSLKQTVDSSLKPLVGVSLMLWLNDVFFKNQSLAWFLLIGLVVFMVMVLIHALVTLNSRTGFLMILVALSTSWHLYHNDKQSVSSHLFSMVTMVSFVYLLAYWIPKKEKSVDSVHGIPLGVINEAKQTILEILCIVCAVIIFVYVPKEFWMGISQVYTMLAGALSRPLFLVIFIIGYQLLWYQGYHGDALLASIVEPLLVLFMVENLNTVLVGGNLNAINVSFYTTYIMGTGAGITLPLVILNRNIKDKTYRETTLIPSLFNVNESVIYGYPVVGNKYVKWSFILVPIVCAMYGYVMIQAGYAQAATVAVPWMVPPLFKSWIATRGDMLSVAVELGMYLIAFIGYLPAILYNQKNSTTH